MCAKMRGVDDASFAPQGEGACVVIGLVAIASSNEAFVFRRSINRTTASIEKVSKDLRGATYETHSAKKSYIKLRSLIVTLIDETP